MLQINSTTSTPKKQVAFCQNITKSMVEVIEPANLDSGLSQKAIHLLKKISLLIDENWKNVKKNKQIGQVPELVKDLKNNKKITIKPLYNMNKEYILFQIDSDKSTDRFIIDKIVPYDFKYEHSVKTDFGSATTKSYNSYRNNNKEMTQLANDNISKYFPEFLKLEPKKNKFIK